MWNNALHSHAAAKEIGNEIARRYVVGVPVHTLAQELGRARSTVRYHLKHRGVQLRDPAAEQIRAQCYSVNSAAFDLLTPECAYWLGFFYADGCVGDTGSINLTLAECDSAHVEKFKAFLSADAPVRAGKRVAAFSIVNRRLAATLACYGIVPRKSLVAIPPRLPPSVERHFWRGVVDGDGCLYQGKYFTLDLSGTYATCNAFLLWARRFIDTKTSVRPSGNIFRVVFSAHKASRIAQELYQDGDVALLRKAQKAKENVL